MQPHLIGAIAGALVSVSPPAGAQPITHRAVVVSEGEDFATPPFVLTTTSVLVGTAQFAGEASRPPVTCR